MGHRRNLKHTYIRCRERQTHRRSHIHTGIGVKARKKEETEIDTYTQTERAATHMQQRRRAALQSSLPYLRVSFPAPPSCCSGAAMPTTTPSQTATWTTLHRDRQRERNELQHTDTVLRFHSLSCCSSGSTVIRCITKQERGRSFLHLHTHTHARAAH